LAKSLEQIIDALADEELEALRLDSLKLSSDLDEASK
jgi:hypothetical protein